MLVAGVTISDGADCPSGLCCAAANSVNNKIAGTASKATEAIWAVAIMVADASERATSALEAILRRYEGPDDRRRDKIFGDIFLLAFGSSTVRSHGDFPAYDAEQAFLSGVKKPRRPLIITRFDYHGQANCLGHHAIRSAPGVSRQSLGGQGPKIATLAPPPRVVEVFVAQNPDCSRLSRPAQIGLKPSSSRTSGVNRCGLGEMTRPPLNRLSSQGLNSTGIKSRIAAAGTKYFLAMSLSPSVP
jgi:hypothetical protein